MGPISSNFHSALQDTDEVCVVEDAAGFFNGRCFSLESGVWSRESRVSVVQMYKILSSDLCHGPAFSTRKSHGS